MSQKGSKSERIKSVTQYRFESNGATLNADSVVTQICSSDGAERSLPTSSTAGSQRGLPPPSLESCLPRHFHVPVGRNPGIDGPSAVFPLLVAP